MFPLGTVLFPHALLPLHVFEPRYRVMTEHVLRGDGEFGVVLIERGSEVGGGDTRFDVGTVARVVRAQELPDGGYALATVGIRRVRVERWLPDDPYPQAEVVELADAARSPATTAGLRARARRRARRRVRALPPRRSARSRAARRSPTTPSRRRTRSRRWRRSARSTRSACSRPTTRARPARAARRAARRARARARGAGDLRVTSPE